MRNLNNILLSGILIAFCWLAPIISTSQMPAVYNINKYNGLSTNHVYNTLVDELGYLWIATDDGVFKYNGYSFDVFDYDKGLPSNDVWCLTRDSKNRMWLSSIAAEVGYIQNGVYKNVYKHPDVNAYLIYPISFFEYGDEIYITSAYNGTQIYSVRNDTMAYPGPPFSNNASYAFSNDNIIEFGSVGDTIKFHKTPSILKSATEMPIPYKTTVNPDLKSHSAKSGDVKFFAGYFIFTTLKDTALPYYSINENAIREFSLYDSSARTHNRLLITAVSPNELKLITDNAAYIIDTNFRLKRKYDFKIMFHGVGANNFSNTYFLEDKLWGTILSTDNNGLFIQSNVHANYKKIDGGLTGYKFVNNKNDTVGCWWNEKEANLAFVTNGCITKKIELPEVRELYKILFLSQDTALIFHRDMLKVLINESSLYNYTQSVRDYYENGKKITDPLKVETDLYYLFDAILPNNRQYDTLYSIGGAGTRAFRLTIDRERKHIESRTVSNMWVKSLTYDRRLHYLYLYNKNSLLLYDTRRDTLLNIPHQILTDNNIRGIRKILCDEHGNIFISGHKQIHMYNIFSNRLIPIFTSYNMKNAHMEIIDGYLVIGCRAGVIKCRISGRNTITDIVMLKNPKNIFYTDITDAQFSKNNALLNTDNGFYLIQYKDMSPVNEGNLYSIIISNRGYLRRLNTNDTISVNQAANVLDIDAINPIGTGPLKLQYAVNESGFVNTGNQLILPDFKPGSYSTVFIIASDDSWRSKPLKFTVYIQPKWWQTQTAKRIIFVLSLLAFIGFVYIVIVMTRRFVNRANERRNQRRELELKSIYSQINPHFIFNSLSTAQYFVKKNKNKEAFEHINQFSDLLRSYIKSSRAKYITIAEEIENLENYLQLQLTRFEEKFDYTIEVDKSVDTEKVKIPSLLLQPLVENALNHGIFHSDKKGNLSVIFKIDEQDKDTLVCMVDDDGIGRQRSKELRGKMIRRVDSYGTILIKELIGTFNKYEKINIEIEYIDKQLPLTGTTVVIRIKNFAHAQ